MVNERPGQLTDRGVFFRFWLHIQTTGPPAYSEGQFYSLFRIRLLGVLVPVVQQSTDGQGDLLLLLIHSGDLGIHDLALGQNVTGLLDAAIGDLGDVDQASAKAPKVISFTIRTEATSPTL